MIIHINYDTNEKIQIEKLDNGNQGYYFVANTPSLLDEILTS